MKYAKKSTGKKKILQLVVRIGVFLVTVVVLGFAALVAYRFVQQAAPGGTGGSIDVGSVPGADGVFIGAYLEANEGKLKAPAGSDDTAVTFVIQPGETVAQIADHLQAQGLIVDAELFRRYVQYHELDTTIEAGEFTLRQTMTIPQVAEALQQGRLTEQTVTIQEGLRLEQIAATVGEQTTIPEADFLTLVTTGWRSAGFSYDFLDEIPPDGTLEGVLFPDTYRLFEDATAEDLVDLMLRTFDEKVTADVWTAAADHDMTGYELIIMASIVEREAVLDQERPFIASVYVNRWESGWLLNADPTVQYGMASAPGWAGEWWPQLTPEDYQSVVSPYNTYRNIGLPPSPICSPGAASIEAAAYPADTDYFYFLVDCTKEDGSHIFAVTEEQHLQNYAMCGGSPP